MWDGSPEPAHEEPGLNKTYNKRMVPVITIAAWCALAVQPSSRLPVIRTAPDFQLIDTREKPISLRQFRGKAVLVAFFFTTCNGTCPATTHRLAKVQAELANQPALKDRVQLLSLTLDPTRDTPEKLRGYLRLYDVEERNWSFVTGGAKEIAQTMDAWGIWAKPAADGQLDHPSRVYLVDPAGRIREIYNLEFLRTPWVIEDLRLVLDEAKH